VQIQESVLQEGSWLNPYWGQVLFCQVDTWVGYTLRIPCRTGCDRFNAVLPVF